MLQRIICFTLLSFFIVGCKKDKSALLIGRWDFMALEMPGMDDFIDDIKVKDDDAALAQERFFLGNKLILRKDSTYDLVLLKQYLHGTWQYDKESQNLFLNDASAAHFNLVVRIDSINPQQLRFGIDEFSLDKLIDKHVSENSFYSLLRHKAYCEFYLDLDNERFTNLEDDPYSVVNNKWRMKPSVAETDTQLKVRVLNHLDFWQLLFKDAEENDRAFVAYNWFSSPLVVASNGVRLNFYEEAKPQWDQNFYDSTDANKAYQMMRKCFDKKIEFMQTDNKFKKQQDVIKQLKENFLAGINIQQ